MREKTAATRKGGPASADHARTRVRSAIAALAMIGAAALVVLPLGQAANANLGEPQPAIEPATGPDSEIRIASTGAGLTIVGLEPPTASTQDPAAPYPAADPAGYTSTSTFAGTIIASSISDPTRTAAMYCINLRVSTQVGIGYESGTWAESNVPNIGYVTYILNHYYPTTNLPSGTTNVQAAAVQSAIWYFTDGFVVSSSNTTVRPLAAAIVADAQANGPSVEPPPPNVTVTPASASAPVGESAGPYTVQADAGATVTVSVPTGYEMFADEAATQPIANPSTVPSGTQVWVRSTSATPITDTVLRARAAVTVERGEVYLYDGYTPDLADAQRLILANTTELDATASAAASYFAVGELTVNKAFAGDAVGQQGPSQLAIDCGDGYVFTADIAAGATTTQTFTYAGIPIGATCVVTEPSTGAGAAVDVSTDAPQQAAIVEAGASVTITNTATLRPGSLTVTKVVTGAAAGQQGEIVLAVTCGDALDETFTIPASAPAGDYAQSYTGIPAGTACTVTEQETGATSTVAVSESGPVDVTIEAGVAGTAEVTNTVTAVTPVPPVGPVTPVDPGQPVAPAPSPSGLAYTGSDVSAVTGTAAVVGLAFGAVLIAVGQRSRRRRSIGK